MQRVLVIDQNEQPLMPCFPARARELLKAGKAAVYRRYPFTIILKERECGDTQPIAFKVDPGSKVTGIALVTDFKRGKRVVWAAELAHRGQQIKNALESRRASRRSRRQRKTRYRVARFNNRRRPKGWLTPSLMSRVHNIMTWGSKLHRFTPITSISMELVRFDTQAMQNAEISGAEYRQGELMGYEVREYLLEKWARKCAYCGEKDVRLEVEHIIPKSRGGSDRISNLTLACNGCNQQKGSQTAVEFGYPDIQGLAKIPLKDAAAVNATRWQLHKALKLTGLPIEVGTGGRTKYNRATQGYPKAHWLDAVCVGESGAAVWVKGVDPLQIKATGHGTRKMCATDKHGFPKQHRTRVKRNYGFQTGDIVKGVIPNGKHAGTHIGQVTIRVKPQFEVSGADIHPKYCVALHRADGYSYG